MTAIPGIVFLAALALLAQTSRPVPPAPIRFRNVAPSAGLDFVLENSPTAEKHLIETMPGGVAVFDYDGDGLPDIFFTNGASVPSLEKSAEKFHNRLFRNLGGMKFKDVTMEAGLAGVGYSIGAAAADYDNDGHVDLFVAGVRSNHLYRNLGNGNFADVTAKAGIGSAEWSITGGWFDYDNDGLLDLFVVNYVKWSPEIAPFCGDPVRKLRAYCHPRFFDGLANRLYHNRGDGTFEDVSERSGIASQIGKGMSVAFADYDGDGLTDIFVTNDKLPNFLFRNLGNGKFAEVALETGAALPDSGRNISGMGVDFRDYDNDGLPDIVFTALAGETFPLFRNHGGGEFRDWTYRSRIGPLTNQLSGWSNGLFDFNNDGWKDLFTANGHVNDTVETFEAAKYKLANSVFASAGDGTFREASSGAGSDFQQPRAHRGAAFADFNRDGKIDVVATALGEPAELWQNISPDENSWLILKLRGTRSNRDGIGARIRIGNQSNEMTSSVGYASSSHFGVHFGLGAAKQADRIEIRWPSGVQQVLRAVRANQVLEVIEPAK
ncbi:MAG TPA: CRTAC1 family protein [Bryobacteraceae bacterium]|nr:CRTAC1 family protein [Bryobacteraceae bacterium]